MKKSIFLFVIVQFVLNILNCIEIGDYPIFLQNKIGKGKISIIVQGEENIAYLKALGSKSNSEIGDLATFDITSEMYKTILAYRGMVFYPSIEDQPLLAESTSNLMNGDIYRGCNVDKVQELGIDGEGVIVAVLDYYPLNWKHEDFYETHWANNDLRILEIWDQTDDSGIPPGGFTYGRVYSKSDLMNDNGPAISGGNHGTACTGIAAGDGSGSEDGSNKGIASKAEIIYVRKKSDSANTIDAISYFQSKADILGKPIVLSFSGGTYLGFPDGSDPVSLAIDAFCEEGRLAAIAGGNYYNMASNHALGNTTLGNNLTDLTYQIDSYTNSGSSEFSDFLDAVIYYKEPDNFNVTVLSPDQTAYFAEIGEDLEFDTDFGKLYIVHNTGNIEVVLTDQYGSISVGDVWTIQLECPNELYDDMGGIWNGWLYENNITGQFTNYSTSASTMNLYACANECIGVAAFSKSNGYIYSASSEGLSLDGRQKPDIAAPTYAITTDNSSSTGYSSLSGTSGAAPHVAGVLALILQRYPNITPEAARELLLDSANIDNVVESFGEVPNSRFGFGKLNALSAVFTVLPPPTQIECAIDETQTSVLISWENHGFEYKIYSSDNPNNIFPASWNLVTSVVDESHVTLPLAQSSRFFIVTAEIFNSPEPD